MLAILVGMVQGGTQALSRSMFASMIPRHKSSEFFAFFGVFERYAGILGPLVFASMVDATGPAATRSSRCWGSSSSAERLLAFVDVESGRRAAPGCRGGPARLVTMSTRANWRPPLAARVSAWLFYRVDLIGDVPATGAVLLLPNHPNSLLDPALVWATAGRDVRFLAKSTLFDGPMRPDPRGRRRDPGVSPDG